MRRSTGMAAAVLAAALSLTACSSGHQPSAADSTSSSSSTLNTPKQQPPAPSVQLVWSHTTKAAGDTEVWYVARVKNSGSSAASVALDARALDKTGTIVGSSQDVLPNIPAGATFDYFGNIGGGLRPSLTGSPATIQVSQAKNAFGEAGAVEQPMLKTSDLKLSQDSEDTYTDAPLSYNLSVKVTNSTRDELTSGVTQQVVLYDSAGHIVGGGTGSSDNVPDSLPAGMSYRERWTGIPALAKATRAVYTVWGVG